VRGPISPFSVTGAFSAPAGPPLPEGEEGERRARRPAATKRLVGKMNTAVYLLRSPESLARLLEAAGAVGLERTGTILDEQVSGESESEE